jgi:hypothetical protein
MKPHGPEKQRPKAKASAHAKKKIQRGFGLALFVLDNKLNFL